MRTIVLAASSLALIAGPALAKDRAPTPQERAAIEKVLKAQGFTSWEEIELDDDSPRRAAVWDVDDARGSDGKAFDLKLEPVSPKVLRKTAD